MGFLNGRLTYLRFQVSGDSPLPFGPETLEKVEQHAIGRHGVEAADGVSFGWAGGDHVLDTTFELEKNILNDALHLAIRIDTDKIPGDLLRAYTTIELDARARLNPSGTPTKAQREEAKEAARARAESEAADGRYRKRKHYPVLWDGQTNTLYAGTTSAAVLDRILALFRDTFDRGLEPVSAGRLFASQAEARGELAAAERVFPVRFAGGETAEEQSSVIWTESDPNSRDYWGNEFLVWLWHTLQNDSDTIKLADGSEVAVMLAKTLTLDCPLGQNGSDNMKDEGPCRLPEAFRALQSGKLPRKAGLILVRHDQQYEFTMQAESLAVNGLALPKLEGARGTELKWGRVDSLRHLVETLDLLFAAYGAVRTGPDWPGDLGRIREWLHHVAA